MPAWNSYSYVFGPLTVAVVFVILVLLLRWAFSSGASLVERSPREGRPDEYGLLVDVAAPPTYIEGELLRRDLEEHGVRATLAHTRDGPRVLVFRDDERTARAVLARRR